MSAIRMLFPLALVAGGVVLVVSEAKASAKKAKTKDPLGIGLDNPESPNGPLPPPPMVTERAFPNNPITQTLFNNWWAQTPYGEEGVPGFWIYETDTPPNGLDWIGPFPFLQFGNPNVAVGMKDGSLWYWDNGWHPAPKLADDYDAWYASTH